MSNYKHEPTRSKTQIMKNIKKWIPLFGTQFLGVLNDNFLKSLICFVSVLWLAEPEQESIVVTIATGLLVLPYLLFSPIASRMTNKRSKRSIVVWAKFFEIPIMLVAIAGFIFQSIPIVLAALFFMGLQSALYSPSKYGLIRDIGGLKGLSFGTGTMELLSFVALLMGTVLAGFIADLSNSVMVMSIVLIGLAVIGWLSSIRINAEEDEVEQKQKEQGSLNPVRFLSDSFKWSKQIKGLNMTILGLAGFWLVGSMLQMNLIIHLPHTMGFTKSETSLIIALVAVGIGVGCWLAGVLAKGRVEIGMVPIGGLGMTFCLALLSFANLSNAAFIVILFFGAMCSGFFKVPLNAWIQQRVKGRRLGQILAYTNMAVFTSILVSAILFGLLESYFDTMAIFKTMAIVAFISSVITLVRVPQLVLRFVIYVIARCLYRVRVRGLENMPKDKGALVIANHVSFLDSFLLVAAAPRNFRFVMHSSVYNHKLLSRMMRRLNMIPVNPRGGANDLREFNEKCQKQINQGHVVVIFAEGTISRTGHLLGFKKGMEHIAKGIDAPIIPIHMDGLVGTPFTFVPGNSKMVGVSLAKLRRRVNITIGEPLANTCKAFEARQAHYDLHSQSFVSRVKKSHTLGAAFVKVARSNSYKNFAANGTDKAITFAEALQQSIELALVWKKQLNTESEVAIVLPQSTTGSLTNLSLTLAGKTAVNIDIHNTDSEIEKILNSASSSYIITSHNFRTITENMTSKTVIYIEDVLNNITASQRWTAKTLSHWGAPEFVQNFLAGRKMQSDSIATVVFEKDEYDGQYYGVELSHRNILANHKGVRQVYGVKRGDSMLGVMPFSRSFGYCNNLWMPALAALKVVFPYDTSDLDNLAKIIVKQEVNILACRNDVIELMYFTQSKAIWKQLDHVITGNRIDPEVKQALRAWYDLEVKESFGFAETTAVIAVNTPDYVGKDIAGKNLRQKGSEDGRVGRPIPGVHIKVVDPADLDRELSAEEVGLIMVKGPNVATGYYKDKSAAHGRFYEGWFVTGERGFIDEKGFIGLAS